MGVTQGVCILLIVPEGRDTDSIAAINAILSLPGKPYVTMGVLGDVSDFADGFAIGAINLVKL